MNEHFYNGFIKRAQDYGISPVKANQLYKLAGPQLTPFFDKDHPAPTSASTGAKRPINAFKKPTPPPTNPADAAYAGYPKDPVTGNRKASQNTIDAFKP